MCVFVLSLGVACLPALFLIGARRASLFFPGFDRFKRSFKASAEEFLPPKLLPVLSTSFALVVASLALTAHKIAGPPLCYLSCGRCLANWKNGVLLSANRCVDKETLRSERYSVYSTLPPEEQELGCGYENGRELLGYYTIGQSGFLSFLAVIIGLMTCMAWRVTEEELEHKRVAETYVSVTQRISKCADMQ
jgi:hypothetical protein